MIFLSHRGCMLESALGTKSVILNVSLVFDSVDANLLD